MILRQFFCPHFINILYMRKLSDLFEATKDGYKESKKIFEAKLNCLKKDKLDKLQNNIVDYEKTDELILEYAKNISKLEMEIADLKILLAF